MDAEKQLKQIFNVVLDEMKANTEFASKIEKILGSEVKKETTKKRGRQPAILNPNILANKGEDILREELNKLEVAQLKDIISQYAMDPSKMASRWRNKDKILNHIVEVAIRRSKQGDAFR